MVNRMAEREAHILADLSYSSRRVLVPPIQSPLSEEKLDLKKKNFNPSLITLQNLQTNYLSIKGFVSALLFIDM